jgi:hypothetical protein
VGLNKKFHLRQNAGNIGGETAPVHIVRDGAHSRRTIQERCPTFLVCLTRGQLRRTLHMLNAARKIGTVVALTGALGVATATPSEARWFGRGWGWGAPVAAGIGLGLAGAAIASAAVGPGYYYGGYYGYPAYGYGYGYDYGYPYAYDGGPAVAYGYDYGPAVYAGYGWGGYGYAAPSYYGSYAYETPAPTYRVYRQARRSVTQPVYAHMRATGVRHSYAMATHHKRQSIYNNVAHATGPRHVRVSSGAAAGKAQRGPSMAAVSAQNAINR